MHIRVSLLVAVGIWYTAVGVTGGESLAPDPENALPVASFRLTFGLKDTKPTGWDGKVIPAQGQVVRVEEDRFRNNSYGGTGLYGSQDIVPPFPNDHIDGPASWVCSSRLAAMYGTGGKGPPRPDIPPAPVQSPSVLLHVVRGSASGAIDVRTPAGEFRFRPADIHPFERMEFLDGRVRVEWIPPVAGVALERLAQQDFASVLTTRSGSRWVAWQEYDDKSDAVVVRERTDDGWSAAMVVAPDVDAYRTALGEDAHGRVWVVWGMKADGNWDLFGRAFDGTRWSDRERLTTNPSSDIYHKLVADSAGHLWLVWQRNSGPFSRIMARSFDGKTWSAEETVSEGLAAGGNNWWPVVAAGPDGMLAVAWDGYASGNYDVYLRRREAGKWSDVERVAGTLRFEAHPSVAIDSRKRIWLAWDESGPEWGKDVGFLVIRKGTQLHESRSVRLACLEGGAWKQPVSDPASVLPPGESWELPHLQLDSEGHPCLLLRHQVRWQPNAPIDAPAVGSLWEIQAIRYDGENWTGPVCFPRSTGRNEMMPATSLAHDGAIWAVWPTDLRDVKGFLAHQLELEMGELPVAASGRNLTLEPLALPPAAFAPIHPHEAEDVRRIRGYRVNSRGRTFSIYRGDLHRHTDLSVDGSNDGALLDAYRYARDAAALDFLGIADHHDTISDPVALWRSHKVADLYQIRNAFAAFYGYERSVEFPNGHRNIFFIERGPKVSLIFDGEFTGQDGPQRLYWYLRRHNGFSIPHTTGRSSGTDWRNGDPKVETLLEIYQGERDTYEYPGSPHPKRLWSEWLDPNGRIPIESSQENSRSFRRLGFAWNGLALGHKLGFIASSDHISSHIGYACLLAEQLTLESLLEAVRHRRSYAATDNIILDIHNEGSDGDHLMGEAFASSKPVQIKANILGTGEILQVDIIKDGAIVQTYKPARASFEFEYIDPKAKPGESYYYVRVVQKDGEMAWGSPVWVDYGRERD